MPEISIITPALCDTEEKVDWLIEMIQSLKAQTFINWELIIVDDFSPVSLERAKAHGDERVRWFRAAQHSGPSKCRNTAVALAVADGILPVDADDSLAENDTLQVMVDAWQADKKSIVYGDLQRQIRAEAGKKDFRRGKVYQLPEYSFKRVLDPKGIIPITGLHSRECFEQAGGWSEELEFGLEDVEYWIKAGLAGFCGKRIPRVTLLYRKHSESRYGRLSRNGTNHRTTRETIIGKHKDVYDGRYPMGCCGSRGAVAPRSNGTRNPHQAVSQKVTRNNPNLDQYESREKLWIQYEGKRQATFGMHGKFTGISYQIQGTGHKFQVHRNDLPLFRRSGRGKDFTIGVAPPEEYVEPPAEQEPPAYQAPPPVLAEVERLDKIAADMRGLDLPPAPPSPPAPPEPEVTATELSTPSPILSLEALNLGSLFPVLDQEGWTVEKLAEATHNDLMPYKGIGKKRAQLIIKRAGELMNG